MRFLFDVLHDIGAAATALSMLQKKDSGCHKGGLRVKRESCLQRSSRLAGNSSFDASRASQALGMVLSVLFMSLSVLAYNTLTLASCKAFRVGCLTPRSKQMSIVHC